MANIFGISCESYINIPLQLSTEEWLCVAVFHYKEVMAGSM